MTRYRCIKEFEIPKVDDNGFETGEYWFVEADSVWVLDEKTNYIGGQNDAGGAFVPRRPNQW